MAGAYSARIMLHEKSPSGLRTAEFGTSWTGKLIASPRTSLPILKQRAEVQGPGLYLLTGPDPESYGSTRVYIGEGEKLWDRIYKHNRDPPDGKEFWNSIFGVVSKSNDSELTKTPLRYLESLTITRASEIGRSVMDNNTAPKPPPIQEIERSEMDNFFGMMTTMLPLMGCNVLSPTRPLLAPSTLGRSNELTEFDELFTIKMRNGVEACGIQLDSEFVVLKDSTASMKDGASWVNARNYRDRLIREGALVVDGEHYRFTRDIAFSSPSAAACVVRAMQTNGRYAWKDSQTGQQYVEIYGRIHKES